MIVPAEVLVGVVRTYEAEVSERALCYAGSVGRVFVLQCPARRV